MNNKFKIKQIAIKIISRLKAYSTSISLLTAAALLLSASIVIISGSLSENSDALSSTGNSKYSYPSATDVSQEASSTNTSEDTESFFSSLASSLASAKPSSSAPSSTPTVPIQGKLYESIFALGNTFMDTTLIKKQTYINPYKSVVAHSIAIDSNDDFVALSADAQKVEFRDNGSGSLVMKTYIRKGKEWIPFYDSGSPLIQGQSFNDHPTSYTISENSAKRKAVILTGKNNTKGYDFEYLVEVTSDSPLIHFRLTNHLTRNLTLGSYEPKFMLWRDSIDPDRISINQEVPTYQTVDDTVYWKSGLPATYLYTNGMESAIFYDMTPMTWYSFKGGVRRFQVSQVRTVVSGNKTGSGLDLRSNTSGNRITSGDMVVDFYIYGSEVSKRPTKLNALSTVVEVFGGVLPSEAKWPNNYVDGSKTSYLDYTDKIIEGLMAENITYRFQPVKATNNGVKIWKDKPLFENRTVNSIIQRPGYALKSPDSGSSIYGDWNCNNNTLIPWILFARINPDKGHKDFLNRALAGLVTYYDSKAQLIRSFEEQPGYTGNGLEFTFQNFFMHQETLWASYMLPADEFDPALGGKFLQATEGLIKLAHNCNYVFPQLFSAATHAPANSIDETHLGTTYEVWSGCIYAYNMCLAYDLTGSESYLNEAKTAIEKLFNGMSYYVNDLKQKLYTDPYEFPINEVSSAPWGIAAANMLHAYTGDAKWLIYSQDIRNVTLRMMNWFESTLKDDPIDKSIAGLALFHAFPTTETTCTWENIMTYLPMTVSFKNINVTPDPLTLKLFNLYRINAFNFCGPSWNPATVPTAKQYTSSPAGWLAVEDYYSAETPTQMGQNGPNTYMSNGPMFNYILFEGYSKASDRNIMALNLDCVDAIQKMSEGIERSFIYFNGTAQNIDTTLLYFDLDGSLTYQLSMIDSKGKITKKSMTGQELLNGIPYSFKPNDHVRISVICLDKSKTDKFTAIQKEQKRLIAEYAFLQTKALKGVDADIISAREKFNNDLVELLSDSAE